MKAAARLGWPGLQRLRVYAQEEGWEWLVEPYWSRNVSMPAKPHKDARENLGFHTGPDS